MRFGSITQRFVAWFVIISLLPMLLLGYGLLETFEQELQRTVAGHISAIADKKVDQIDDYLNGLVHDALEKTRGETTRHAMVAFSQTFSREGVESAAYRQLDTRYRDHFQRFVSGAGYYDLFLISPQGTVVYSQAHEPDFATSLFTGPYRDSGLARVASNALRTLESGISGFELYAPSGNAIAAFVAVPIMDQGKVEGVLALQIDSGRVYQVLMDRTGMGESGETVVAQLEDEYTARVMAPLKFDPDAALKRKISLHDRQRALPLLSALNGERGSALAVDYRGQPVVAAWRYLPRMGWGMVTKMDTKEAFAPLYRVRNFAFLVLGLVFLAALAGAVLLGRRVVNPLKILSSGAQKLAAGQLEQRVPFLGRDELGQVAASFNSMAEHLQVSHAELEIQVAQRTAELTQSLAELCIRDAAIASSINAFAIADLDGKHTYVNQAFADLWRLDRKEDAIGRSALEFVEKPEDMQVLFDALQVQGHYRGEISILRHDGSLAMVELSANMVPDETGKPICMVGSFIDISERKQAEFAMQFAQNQLEATIDAIPDLLFELGLDGTYHDIHAQNPDLLAEPEESLLGKKVSDMLAPEAADIVMQALQEANEQGRSHGKQFKLSLPDGAVWFELSVSRKKTAPEQEPHFIVLSRDITARKQMELALNDSATILNEAQHIAQVGSWELDLLTGELKWSDEIFNLFEIDKSQFDATYEAFLNAIHPDDRDSVNLAYSHSLETRSSYEITHRLQMSDGRIKWVRERGTSDFDTDGKPIRSIGTVQNITRQMQTEIALNEAMQAAEVASRAKSVFLANMSHEIRTPMNAILGLTRLVLDSELSPPQHDALKKAHASARSLLGILNDILDYSKIEAGHMGVEQVAFRLEDSLRQVNDLFGPLIEEKGLELIFEVAPDVPAEILGDPLRLGQVLTNLLSNAVKFTERGNIHLKLEVDERTPTTWQLRFSVRDTGIGLTSAQSERLFQPFIQADSTTTRKYGGTGLGLSICQRLVTMMGGEITVSGARGQGTTFTFTIQAGVVESHSPVAVFSQHWAAEAEAGGGLVGDGGDTTNLQGARILLVEDNEINRLMAATFLTRRGVVLTMAADGREAVERVKGETFDAVLMDLHMPVMDGLDATRLICELPLCKSLPVIAMTAAVQQEDRDRCIAAGMVDFIAKPIDPESMISVLSKWVKTGGPVPREQVVIRALPTIGVLPPSLPGFDLSAALQRLDGNRDLLAQLLRDFSSELQGKLAQLDALAEAGDSAQMLSLLHTLKGVSANLGAVSLAEAARQLEAEIKSGNVSASRDDFSAALDAALAAINTHIAPAQSSVGYGAVDPDELATVLKRLTPYLQEHELIPVDLMASLHSLAGADFPDKSLARLILQLDHFDHDGALASVVKLAVLNEVSLE